MLVGWMLDWWEGVHKELLYKMRWIFVVSVYYSESWEYKQLKPVMW